MAVPATPFMGVRLVSSPHCSAACGAICAAANTCIPLINFLNESNGLERPGCIVSLGIEGADNCENLIIGK